MSESSPKNIGLNFGRALEGIGQKIGILPSEEMKAEIQRQKQEDREQAEFERREFTKKMHMLYEHANLCTSEIEYVLGYSSYDPDPGHPIVFTECQHADEEIFGKNNDETFPLEN